MAHKDTTLALPTRGVVLVTGGNGSGKSSIVEGVSVALWGQTVRGTAPWSGPDGEAAVVTDLACAIRKRKKGKVMLDWNKQGEPATKFENTTKAQDALESVVGPWEVWRRCSLFSSADATHFSLATDGERKRLLERILGIERFDVALDACRKDLKQAEAARDVAERGCFVEGERLRSEQRRLAEAQSWLGDDHVATEDVEALRAKAENLRALVEKSEADLRSMTDMSRRGATSQGELAAMARQARATLERLRGATCPTCSQPIPQALRDKLEREAQEAQAAHEQRMAAANEELAKGADLFDELNAERAALEGKLREAAHAYRSAKLSRDRDAQVRATVADATAKVGQFELALAEQEERLAQATKLRDELQACEQVLGLKGVRAHVLARALGGIEAVANVWLSRVAGRELRLKLSPYTEKKTGGVSDSISLDIIGAGDGHGYRAASGGERRRLDVALLLALAEVASAAHSGASGTLFFDEVFDLLDPDGVQRISAVLHELAQDRCVVIVSHSDAIAQTLRSDRHVHVDNGVVTMRT